MMLFPSRGFLKSSRVTLNIIRPRAKTINMFVKIFITEFLKNDWVKL